MFRHLTTQGALSSLLPMTVVDDAGELVVTWIAAGTPIVYPALAEGADLASVPAVRRFDAPHTTVRRTWQRSALCVIPIGASHSVRHSWEDHGAFERWYVNLEAPKQDWDLGLQTVDHLLDLVIGADRAWSWKDEDEAAAAVRAGFLPAEALASARAEGERILADLDRWPGDVGDWTAYRPPPGWSIPPIALTEAAWRATL